MIISGAMYFVAHRFQGPAIDRHVQAGGDLYSTWRAIAIGLLTGLIVFVVLFSIPFLILVSVLRT